MLRRIPIETRSEPTEQFRQAFYRNDWHRSEFLRLIPCSIGFCQYRHSAVAYCRVNITATVTRTTFVGKEQITFGYFARIQFETIKISLEASRQVIELFKQFGKQHRFAEFQRGTHSAAPPEASDILNSVGGSCETPDSGTSGGTLRTRIAPLAICENTGAATAPPPYSSPCG